ncbi:mechanosensitive ion channel family protein [Pelistega suis]|uniref:Small-conductance mechanosensitive channel n=1 Tax=Pelistega suis TaxID=1631957 RepID=A0A849P706_9BURK|nr:mechanosensitive ion channel domain-containing protein [Pelistega suis]MCQ9328397.1 mechanosensitive ion channel [Pelistega suis]NOL51793.1 mechanosensitive ion channel [Pelistega suis]
MNWQVLWEKYYPLIGDFVINFLSALAVFIVGWLISKFIGKSIRKIAHRSNALDYTAVPMIEGIVVWAIRILVILVVLTQFGIKTTSLIAALGAAGLAIGLALQGTLQNIAAGIMLIALRPIRAGESVTISSGGISGTVSEIGLFLTRIIQNDGIQVTVPNSSVWSSTIINFSRNKTRRMDILVPVSYGDDLDKAIEILEEVVAQQENIDLEPKASIYVSEYRESVVVITIRLWTASNVYWNVHAALMKRIRQRLEEHAFQLPVPARISKVVTEDHE